MALNALLLSDDVTVAQILRPLLPELGITTDQCGSPDSARKMIAIQKYETLIIDTEMAGALEFMGSLRDLPMTRNGIIFAVIQNLTVSSAFQHGANFVLEKPLSEERAHRSLRAAQGLILRERRRYYRHPVNFSASLEFGDKLEVVAVTNLSEGGMAVETGVPLTPGLAVRFKFDLPQSRSLEGKGEVSWTDNNGRAGICFVHVPLVYKVKLEDWLNERAREDMLPGMVNAKNGWNQV